MSDNTIILGTTPTTSVILNEEFPELKKIPIEPYAICYSKGLPVSLKLLMDAPRIHRVIKKEHQQLEKIIVDNHIDVVISDNRFGLWNSKAECIYITHQLNIQAGWLSFLANVIHHRFIKHFNQIWVPDSNGKNNLAGNLSKNSSLLNTQYIGALSRLIPNSKTNIPIDYLILLSGPEPQRSLLEQALLTIIEQSTKTIYFVRGSNSPFGVLKNKHAYVINFAKADDLSQLMESASCVICRSGYSTLMDLHTFKKTNIVLIPTPGQREQEYLANYWKETFDAKLLLQKEISNFKLE